MGKSVELKKLQAKSEIRQESVLVEARHKSELVQIKF